MEETEGTRGELVALRMFGVLKAEEERTRRETSVSVDEGKTNAGEGAGEETATEREVREGEEAKGCLIVWSERAAEGKRI